MGGKITSALSRETRELLKQNQFFYDSVIKLYEATSLKFKPADAEAKTEVEQLKDGQLAIHVIVPLDGNGQVSDGRIYLRDTFIFDGKQKQLQKHERNFEYNGRGDNKAEWQKWLQQYKEKAGAADGEALKAFAAGPARSFSRPFSDKQFNIFKKLNNKKLPDGKDNPDFLGFHQSLVAAANGEGLTLRSRDSRSSYAIIHRGLVTEIVFNFALLDNEGKPGHLKVKETFLLDVNTHALVGHKRQAEPAPEVAEDKDWLKKAEAINQAEVPNIESAKKFIAHFLPDILTDAPEFKEETGKDPEGGYPEMNQAMFLKTLGQISRNRKAPAMAQMDPNFYADLDKNGAYLAPLREAMGKGFELNLKDPPLKTSVQVVSGKTQVFATYALKPTSGEAGVLEYSERWTFEKGQLIAVDRQAKALGAVAGGEVEVATQRVKDAIKEGKFGDAKDQATFLGIAAQIGYLAPHLTYVGMPTVLENPQAQIGMEQQMIVSMIQEIQSSLVPILYQNEVDPGFRDDLLRITAAYVHGDQQTLVAAMSSLQKRESAALQAAKEPDQKKRHEENVIVAEIIATLATGDPDRAYKLSKNLVSPAYKTAFAKTLDGPNRISKLAEGLALISKVVEEQIDLGEKQGKGWLSDGSKYSAAERETLKTLLTKVMVGMSQDSKVREPIAAFQAALDYGKNKKPEEMKEEEKKLLLTDAERALASKVMSDTLVKKLANISQEEDKDIQAKEYFELARGPLFEKSLFSSSRFIVQAVVAQKMPKNGASESIEILRVAAMEKAENARNAKLSSIPPLPAELKSLQSLRKKLGEKAQENPATPIFSLLASLENLNEDEKKLVARLQKSPNLKKVNEAASLPTVQERQMAYLELLQPMSTDELLLDDLVAAFEKDPKLSFKKAMEGIPDLNPAQQQLVQVLDKYQKIPEIEQKLAVAVTMPAAERGNYYRQTLRQYLPDLMVSTQIQETLGFMEHKDVKADSQIQGIEGVAMAELLLGLELSGELLPETKKAKAFDREFSAEQKTVQSLLDKAALSAPMNPNASAYTALNAVKDSDLSPAEKDLRQKLVADQSLAKLLEIGAEPDIVKRREAYLAQLPAADSAEPGAIAKLGFAKTEAFLTQSVHTGKIPDVHGYIEMPPLMMGQQPERKHFAADAAMKHQATMVRDVQKFLAMLEGKGDFGSKVGYGMPHFTKELTKPTSLAAMAAAPLVGGVTQVAMLSKLRNLGIIGRGIAVGVGVGAEATTFTYLHAKGEKYAYGNADPEKHFWNDVKSNALLFGAMRGVHMGSAAFGERVVATGRIGKWAGSRVAGESAGSLQTLPTGQLTYIPAGSAAGVPQLTVAGERFMSLLNHGGAITAMYGAGKLSHAAGWQEKPAGVDDAFLMYLQAMVGYNLSNAATGGRLNRSMAEINIRMQSLGGANTLEGLKQQIIELKTDKAKIEEGKKALSEEARREADGQIHKIDGKILGLEKKVGKLETAAKTKAKKGEKDPAAKDEVKDEAGELIQLFEPKPEQLVLSNGEGEPVAARTLKSGDEVSLDAHLLGREGSDVVLKAGADGKLTLHDKQKADAAPDPASGEPAPLPAILQVNGKAVTEATEVAPGDVISAGGKEIQVGISSPSAVHQAIAQVPRAQQLSLSRQIAKAKKISDLFKALRNSPHGGAGEVMAIVAEVLAGRSSVASLPVELGIRSKIQSLIEAQVKEWKKENLSTDGYSLKEGAAPADASSLEVEYHTMRAVLALRSGVQNSATIYELLQALGQSSLQSVGKVSTEQIFENLGIEHKRGLLEQVTKTEAELREKIRIAERAITREKKAWRKTDKEIVETQEKKRDELKTKADGLKQLIDVLKAYVEAADQANAAADGPKLPDVVETLPRELGIRQKGRDALEQSLPEFGNNFSDKQKKDVVDIAKRYLGAQEVDFKQAQSLIRFHLDNGTWQGQLLFRRLKPAQQELAIEVYFGGGKVRNLAPEESFRVADALSKTSLKDSYGVLLSRNEGGARLDLIRGDLDAAAAPYGEVVLLRTHPTAKEAKGPQISDQELGALVEQAKQDWKETNAHPTGGNYREAPKSPFQRSDTVLFSDPETGSFQTWISHGQGISKVRITLDKSGELDSIQIKHAGRPGVKDAALAAPDSLKLGDQGSEVKVEKQVVDFDALTKELPFELKAPGFAMRAMQKATWVGDRIPRMPSLPKFGGEKADATAKPEAKPDAKTEEAKDAKEPKDAKPEADKAEDSQGKKDAKKEDAKKKEEDSFFRGALGWLGRRMPRFGSAKEAPVKVEPKPAKPKKAKSSKAAKASDAKVEPAANPPEAKGSRPTVPNDLQFPPSQIGSGETGAPLSNLEIRQSANSVMGEYAGKTHEGVGRERNEDGIGSSYTHERDLVLVAVDGMGGHANGKEAAVMTLETVNEGVHANGDLVRALGQAHDKVVRDLHPLVSGKQKPGASVGAVKIRRPDSPEGPHSLEANWGGDVSIFVLRKGPDGKRHWIYRNAEDNNARQIVDIGIASGQLSKEGRDLQVISSPIANSVDNVVGGTSGFTPRRTSEGYIPGPDGSLQKATGLDRIALREGDVVLILPDGTGKNLKDPQVLIDLIEGQDSAADITRTIDAWVAERMKTVDRVDQRYEKGEVSTDARQEVVLDGVTRFMDRRGNVFEKAEGGNPIDHYEADNFSAMAYVHNPEKDQSANADFKPPSDTSQSDPDKTQIFQRPPGLDPK